MDPDPREELTEKNAEPTVAEADASEAAQAPEAEAAQAPDEDEPVTSENGLVMLVAPSGKLRAARIVARCLTSAGPELRVHYEGFSKAFDEWIPHAQWKRRFKKGRFDPGTVPAAQIVASGAWRRSHPGHWQYANAPAPTPNRRRGGRSGGGGGGGGKGRVLEIWDPQRQAFVVYSEIRAATRQRSTAGAVWRSIRGRKPAPPSRAAPYRGSVEVPWSLRQRCAAKQPGAAAIVPAAEGGEAAKQLRGTDQSMWSFRDLGKPKQPKKGPRTGLWVFGRSRMVREGDDVGED